MHTIIAVTAVTIALLIGGAVLGYAFNPNRERPPL